MVGSPAVATDVPQAMHTSSQLQLRENVGRNRTWLASGRVFRVIRES